MSTRVEYFVVGSFDPHAIAGDPFFEAFERFSSALPRALVPVGRRETEIQIVVEYSDPHGELVVRQYDNYLTEVRHLELVMEPSLAREVLAAANEHLPRFDREACLEASDQQLEADPSRSFKIALGAPEKVDRATEDLILRALRHRHRWTRAMAAQAVNLLVTNRLIAGLRDHFDDEPPGIAKMWMAQALAVIENDPALSVALRVEAALDRID